MEITWRVALSTRDGNGTRLSGLYKIAPDAKVIGDTLTPSTLVVSLGELGILILYSGLGLLEYLLWCEDLGMEPIMAVWSGR